MPVITFRGQQVAIPSCWDVTSFQFIGFADDVAEWTGNGVDIPAWNLSYNFAETLYRLDLLMEEHG